MSGPGQTRAASGSRGRLLNEWIAGTCLPATARAVALAAAAYSFCLAGAPAQAQEGQRGAQNETQAVIPRFFDPARRIERPDLTGRTLRILTDDDYPPFGFTAPDGTLVGFNVDLARALCETLELTCTIQARRFDTILDALAKNEGEAAVASLAVSPALAAKVEVSLPYYRTPARFVTRASAPLAAVTPQALAGKTIGVESRTAHEAYLKTFFPQAKIRGFPTAAALRAALRAGEIDALFGDGVTLAIWLAGPDPAGCCAFSGGPFTESRWFGDGVAIAVRKGDVALKQGFDWALHRLAQNGRYGDLYLKYFPVGFY